MSRLNRCQDGIFVTEKVLLFQKNHSDSDFSDILTYYDNFRDRWFNILQAYMDREIFDREFDFKLYKAVISFSGQEASTLCDKYGWNFDGAFNRWFYAILRNWRSNVKTAAFRQKKRPVVQCPVCNRSVSRIDEEHLAHYKTKSELPKAFSWRGQVYSVVTSPGVMAVCWGKYIPAKLKAINSGDTKPYMTTRNKIKWPWFAKDGRRGVVCPFTKNIVHEINAEYIRSLSNKHNRYARPFKWHEFIEEYPYPILIQSEIYSLDYHKADEDLVLRNSIAVSNSSNLMTHEDLTNGKIAMEYEHVFYLIESYIENKTDQDIMKLACIGYSDDDIASVLDVGKKEIRQRKKDIRLSGSDLLEKLLEG